MKAVGYLQVAMNLIKYRKRFNREYNDALKKLNKIEFITTE